MKIVLKMLVICAILFGIISIPVFATTGKVVNTNEVRFRANPSAEQNSEILDKLSKGTEVEILGKENGWYKVQYNSKTGYISGDYIEEVPEQTNSNENVVENPENANIQNNNSDSPKMNTENTYKIIQKCNVRLTPIINSCSICVIDKDTECTVVTIAGNWVYIETTTIKGWIEKSKIKLSEEPIETKDKNSNNTSNDVLGTTTLYADSKTGYINTESTNVRKQPNVSGELVTKLSKNTEVVILGEDGGWYLVEVNGIKAYIYKELVSNEKITTTSRSSEYNRAEAVNTASVVFSDTNKANNNAEIQNDNCKISGNDIVNYAKQFLGYPYIYGTQGPDTFDCSGFTSYVYKHFGYNISRSSRTQQYDGVEVTKENLELGDIIIFLNTSKTSVGHVGIYIGDNKFIHASSSTTGVIISDLSSANYPERFVTARRIL